MERRVPSPASNDDLHVVSSEVVPDQSIPPVRTRVDEVRLDVVRLASLTLDAIRAGTEALLAGDLGHADRVVADDDAIDSLRHALEFSTWRSLSELAGSDAKAAGIVLGWLDIK